jgi:hypothetical protein
MPIAAVGKLLRKLRAYSLYYNSDIRLVELYFVWRQRPRHACALFACDVDLLSEVGRSITSIEGVTRTNIANDRMKPASARRPSLRRTNL